MTKRRANGEGSVYHRKDGRYVGAAIVTTASGTRKRMVVYGKTRLEASQKLTQLLAKGSGMPVPDSSVKLADYLDYWLTNFIKPNKAAATWDQYEVVVRLYLKPGLGSRPIKHLTVPVLQAYFNGLLTEGFKRGRVKAIRTVLGGALTRAVREELVSRNEVRAVELPQYQRKEIRPWTPDEATAFLDATGRHRLHAAFVLLVFYGLRRGELLGLRWCDVDFDKHRMRIRQSLQDLKHGRGPTIGPLKTKASRRDLPLSPMITAVLLAHRQQTTQERATLGAHWGGSDGENELIFTSEAGTPLWPGNFVTTFKALCVRHGIRVIKLHHIRHAAATIMKNRGVPTRDIQLILGHATPWVTEQIYQHVDMTSQTTGLGKLEAAIAYSHRIPQAVRPESKSALLSTLLSNADTVDDKTSDQSGKMITTASIHCVSKRRTLTETISILQEEVQRYRSDQPVFLCLIAARRQYWLGRVAVTVATQFASGTGS